MLVIKRHYIEQRIHLGLGWPQPRVDKDARARAATVEDDAIVTDGHGLDYVVERVRISMTIDPHKQQNPATN